MKRERTMKLQKALALVLVLVLGAATYASPWYAPPCPDGKCESFADTWSPLSNEVSTQPVESACIVRGTRGKGSGILVAKGPGYGFVWTCAHGTKEGGTVQVEFPVTREVLSASVIAREESSDTALIRILSQPRAEIAKLAGDLPTVGERLYYAGFGDWQDRWAVFEGRYLRYVPNTDLNGAPAVMGVMEWSGGARQGDSGGPVWSATTGKVFGVIIATDGKVTLGPGVDKLYELVRTGRYVFPWNAALEAQDLAAHHGRETVPVAPVAPQSPGIAEGLYQLEQKLEMIDRKIDGLGVSGAAAAKNAREGTIAALAAAQSGITDSVTKAVGGAGLTAMVKGTITKTLGWFGLGGGVIAFVGLPLGAWFVTRMVRKDIKDYKETGDPLMIQKLARFVPGTWDDKALAGLARMMLGEPGGVQPQQPLQPQLDPLAEISRLREENAALRGSASQPTTGGTTASNTLAA